MPRRVATALTLLVAFLWGALPLRECFAGGHGGIVVAGDHLHDGACHACACTACDARTHVPAAEAPCACGDAACACGDAPCACGDAACGGERAPAPHDGPRAPHDGGCCVDEATSLLRTGVEVALPLDLAIAVLATCAPAAPPSGPAADVAEAVPDDGPPPGVVTVVLLR